VVAQLQKVKAIKTPFLGNQVNTGRGYNNCDQNFSRSKRDRVLLKDSLDKIQLPIYVNVKQIVGVVLTTHPHQRRSVVLI
jgi:hypothetical protein